MSGLEKTCKTLTSFYFLSMFTLDKKLISEDALVSLGVKNIYDLNREILMDITSHGEAAIKLSRCPRKPFKPMKSNSRDS